MWLINTRTLQLEEFYPSQAPPYAILSHTWDAGEVLFRDISSPSATGKKGYSKITQTCRLAREQKLDYAWIDTCCIDKSSSAELTESINSMFKWYQKAEVCYAFLEDLQPGTGPEAFGPCRWFTRGWTLQELLAPSRVDFYDMGWNFIGTKGTFADAIAAITRIPKGVIIGERPISEYSVAARMSWSAHRQTTREEDRAYSLLGIFGIALSLIYGEGHWAFRRLQEELLRRFSDMTIFAWNPPPGSGSPFVGAFASSPDWFAETPDQIRPQISAEQVQFSISNRGILLSQNPPICRIRKTGTSLVTYSLSVGQTENDDYVEPVAVILRKIGPNLFCRDARHRLQELSGGGELPEFSKAGRIAEPVAAISLVVDQASVERMLANNRMGQLRVFPTGGVEAHPRPAAVFTLTNICPQSLWDAQDRVFLRPSLSVHQREMPLCLRFKVQVPDRTKEICTVVVVFMLGTDTVLKLFVENRKVPKRAATFFINPAEPLTVAQLLNELPDFHQLTHRSIVPCHGGGAVSITAGIEFSRLDLTVGKPVLVTDLVLKAEALPGWNAELSLE
jgi:hypothetical protein